MGFGGRMDGCGQCVKFSMFIVNFLIFVSKFKILFKFFNTKNNLFFYSVEELQYSD